MEVFMEKPALDGRQCRTDWNLLITSWRSYNDLVTTRKDMMVGTGRGIYAKMGLARVSELM